MHKEKQLIDELIRKINDIIPVGGWDVHIEPGNSWDEVDFKLHLNYGAIAAEFLGELFNHDSFSLFKKKIERLQYISANRNKKPIVAAYYFSEQRRQYCKENNVFFIDLSGNVFLACQSLYIDRHGYPNKYPVKRLGRSPFSDKASLIIRELLVSKQCNLGIRGLALKLGLDPGFVSRILKELESRKYIQRDGSILQIIDPQDVIDDWVNDYDFRKNKIYSYFFFSDNPSKILERIRNNDVINQSSYALSLQAGANEISPYSVLKEVHIYVEDKQLMNNFVEELDLKDMDKGANVHLMIPYYKSSVFSGEQRSRDLKIVSDLQLYLDLYHYPLRGREQAEKILNDRIMKYWKE